MKEVCSRSQDGGEALWTILGAQVLCFDDTGGVVDGRASRMRRAARLGGGARDENILFDSGGEHAEERVVDVLADDIHATGCACDVSGRMTKARCERFGEGVPAYSAVRSGRKYDVNGATLTQSNAMEQRLEDAKVKIRCRIGGGVRRKERMGHQEVGL